MRHGDFRSRRTSRSAPRERRGATGSRRQTHSRFRRLTLLVISTLPIFEGCVRDAPPSEADRLALQTVQRTVEGRLALALEDELYVTAKLLPGTTVSAAELERVYQHFLFAPDGRRRDTDYVYLNVYAADGDFMFQLTYDPRMRRMIRTRTEHY